MTKPKPMTMAGIRKLALESMSPGMTVAIPEGQYSKGFQAEPKRTYRKGVYDDPQPVNENRIRNLIDRIRRKKESPHEKIRQLTQLFFNQSMFGLLSNHDIGLIMLAIESISTTVLTNDPSKENGSGIDA